jgi:hypothetical protein
MVLAIRVAPVWGGGRSTTSRAIIIIDITDFSKVALLPSPSGLRFEDDSKARAGRLREALQRIR